MEVVSGVCLLVTLWGGLIDQLRQQLHDETMLCVESPFPISFLLLPDFEGYRLSVSRLNTSKYRDISHVLRVSV